MECTNLALAIQHALIETGNVVLPGIGVLRLNYHPARLSRQEGKIYPPSEVPEFDGLDELSEPEPGLLREFLRAENEQDEVIGISRLKQLLADMRSSLDRGESVELPEVGEFSVMEGQIHFRPLSFNYYLEVFGLGPVQARPVMRRTPEQAARIAQESRAKLLTDKPVATPTRRRDRLMLPGLAAVLILALAGCIWLILSPHPSPADMQDAPKVEDSGQILSDEDQPRTDPGDLTEEILGEDPGGMEQANDVVGQADSDESQPNDYVQVVPASVELVRIITGHFSNPDNALGLVSRLEKMGLSAQSEPGKGGLTRVFVLVDPSQADPDIVLANIRREVEPTAWMSQE